MQNGNAQAVICNSGNANTCNADGVEKARRMCELWLPALQAFAAEDVIVASTGVIGQELPVEAIETAERTRWWQALSCSGQRRRSRSHHDHRYREHKEVALEFTLGGKPCRMGGIAKGSRDDSSQYGDHAQLSHHRRGH